MKCRLYSKITVIVLVFQFTMQLNAFTQTLTASKNFGFIENKGQLIDQNEKPNASVLYVLPHRGNNVQLRKGGFSYDTYSVEKENETSTYDGSEAEAREQFDLHDRINKSETWKFHRIDIDFVGYNTSYELIAENKLAHVYNYATAGTPEYGINAVGSYEKITYKNIYPNIDIVFYSNTEGKAFKYDFVLHPGALLSNIKLAYKGMLSMEIGEDAKLHIATSNGLLTEEIPRSYFAESGKEAAVFFQLNDANIVQYACNSAIGNQTLVIDPDPTISWASYAGGVGEDKGYGIIVGKK
jgi:hypothetical protein